ncbi:hypothetical protein FSP39_022314 [Pinctada imbricata]|uniref:Potassium channel domain-containing protein n=1 Tax=Pinctada imbricata TaxID=66713 RepID=A0AA88XLQ8_PINIB|nr:hypothetical protein FSP39_022314 [Pinctada imbricata]
MESNKSFEDLFDTRIETLLKPGDVPETFSDDEEGTERVSNSLMTSNGSNMASQRGRNDGNDNANKNSTRKKEFMVQFDGKLNDSKTSLLQNLGGNYNRNVDIAPKISPETCAGLSDSEENYEKDNKQVLYVYENGMDIKGDHKTVDNTAGVNGEKTKDTFVDLDGETYMDDIEVKQSLCCSCCRKRISRDGKILKNKSQIKTERKLARQRQKERCIKCCKKFTAFLFSHIGLCSLVVAYTILGGFVFMTLEAPAELQQRERIQIKRKNHVERLWNITTEVNVFSQSNWSLEADRVMRAFQADIYRATKDLGWDGKDGEEDAQWSFAGSLLYSITVITTIGYGHIAPKTDGGRFVTIIYALVGIPLTFLCIANLGSLLESCFRIFYKHACLIVIKLCCPSQARWSSQGKRQNTVSAQESLPLTDVTDSPIGVATEKHGGLHAKKKSAKEEVRVPILVSLMLITLYILGGALLFSEWEKGWAMLDGAYFCFITLTTVGFGDLVPGTGEVSQKEKLVLCSFYLFFGLAIIAMCFKLMQDEVQKKCTWLGQKIGIIEVKSS